MFSVCLWEKHMSNYNVIHSISHLYICVHACVCFLGTVTVLWRMLTVYIHSTLTALYTLHSLPWNYYNQSLFGRVEIAVVSFLLIKLTSDNCNSLIFWRVLKTGYFIWLHFAFLTLSTSFIIDWEQL